MKVPFVDLKIQYQSIKSEIDAAIQNVINQTSFIGGSEVDKFEVEFAKLYGAKHCVSVANGTDSLYIIMKMLGIGEGDEVITVSNSWISSSETITQTGAKPVFVDIDPVYYSMNENLIEKRINSNTRAIIPVHLHGQMCEMDKIMELAKKHNLFVIEDCAQSHFSELNGVRAGLRGHAASFSFYPGKNLGAYGDAGCILTDDEALSTKFRMFARHGALKKHAHVIEGINSRLDGIQAGVLNAKLPHILDWTRRRIENAARYTERLKGLEDIEIPVVRPDSKHSFHLYVIRTEKRDELAAHLKANGVETAVHYPTALPNLEAYSYLGHEKSDFPVASSYQDRILSLPMYPELTNEMIDHVADSIESFFAKS
ncbi:DegT/DnrJ/EryC1/StrS family aminotransferase [Daejeonella lutea]|uniref:dTDP-4-amino-4,6-dideoxygalactose transaminase n=1 Tax=Daejeonella lutea TaxID=572036 RepID=A0A1T5FB52_9SPHI|nr:DegT/DnrJ/EryC1/StrS family aminotransferase [Daejeonella lutea]SKB93380.1 dTDP-4-amino-4,6-dideoxygalactose transaminase [Daejeonella lutea]